MFSKVQPPAGNCSPFRPFVLPSALVILITRSFACILPSLWRFLSGECRIQTGFRKSLDDMRLHPREKEVRLLVKNLIEVLLDAVLLSSPFSIMPAYVG